MEFKYLNSKSNHPLIDHFYKLTISKNVLPFKTLVVPIGQTNITYVFCDDYQIAKIKNKDIYYKDLTLTGQIYSSYYLEVNKPSKNLGFAMRPTTLYKILNRDITEFNNKHQSLKEVNKDIYEIFNTIFLTTKNDEAFVKSVYEIFDKLPLSTDPNLKYIDKAIDYILEKEALLKVSDLLKIIPLSQKSLEIQFKKIVGLTPGKYIRQQRFIRLMFKYGNKKHNISDLMHMFNYYDSSHFSRDFKMFLGQTPKEYFKQDFPLIETYLKE
jgi:AraC-like DNA-binding protein